MSLKNNMVLLVLPFFLASCMAAGVKKEARTIKITRKEPQGCDYRGEAVGSQGNSITGKYTTVAAMEQGAMNRLKNQASKLDGDTIYILNQRETKSLTKSGKTIIQNITMAGAVYQCGASESSEASSD